MAGNENIIVLDEEEDADIVLTSPPPSRKKTPNILRRKNPTQGKNTISSLNKENPQTVSTKNGPPPAPCKNQEQITEAERLERLKQNLAEMGLSVSLNSSFMSIHPTSPATNQSDSSNEEKSESATTSATPTTKQTETNQDSKSENGLATTTVAKVTESQLACTVTSSVTQVTTVSKTSNKVANAMNTTTITKVTSTVSEARGKGSQTTAPIVTSLLAEQSSKPSASESMAKSSSCLMSPAVLSSPQKLGFDCMIELSSDEEETRTAPSKNKNNAVAKPLPSTSQTSLKAKEKTASPLVKTARITKKKQGDESSRESTQQSRDSGEEMALHLECVDEPVGDVLVSVPGVQRGSGSGASSGAQAQAPVGLNLQDPSSDPLYQQVLAKLNSQHEQAMAHQAAFIAAAAAETNTTTTPVAVATSVTREELKVQQKSPTAATTKTVEKRAKKTATSGVVSRPPMAMSPNAAVVPTLFRNTVALSVAAPQPAGTPVVANTASTTEPAEVIELSDSEDSVPLQRNTRSSHKASSKTRGQPLTAKEKPQPQATPSTRKEGVESASKQKLTAVSGTRHMRRQSLSPTPVGVMKGPATSAPAAATKRLAHVTRPAAAPTKTAARDSTAAAKAGALKTAAVTSAPAKVPATKVPTVPVSKVRAAKVPAKLPTTKTPATNESAAKTPAKVPAAKIPVTNIPATKTPTSILPTNLSAILASMNKTAVVKLTSVKTAGIKTATAKPATSKTAAEKTAAAKTATVKTAAVKAAVSDTAATKSAAAEATAQEQEADDENPIVIESVSLANQKSASCIACGKVIGGAVGPNRCSCTQSSYWSDTDPPAQACVPYPAATTGDVTQQPMLQQFCISGEPQPPHPYPPPVSIQGMAGAPPYNTAGPATVINQVRHVEYMNNITLYPPHTLPPPVGHDFSHSSNSSYGYPHPSMHSSYAAGYAAGSNMAYSNMAGAPPGSLQYLNNGQNMNNTSDQQQQPQAVDNNMTGSQPSGHMIPPMFMTTEREWTGADGGGASGGGMPWCGGTVLGAPTATSAQDRPAAAAPEPAPPPVEDASGDTVIIGEHCVRTNVGTYVCRLCNRYFFEEHLLRLHFRGSLVHRGEQKVERKRAETRAKREAAEEAKLKEAEKVVDSGAGVNSGDESHAGGAAKAGGQTRVVASRQKFTCVVCLRELLSRESLVDHIETEHSGSTPSKRSRRRAAAAKSNTVHETSSRSESESPDRGSDDGESSASESAAPPRKRKKVLRCDICDRKFKRPCDVTQHKKRKHGATKGGGGGAKSGQGAAPNKTRGRAPGWRMKKRK